MPTPRSAAPATWRIKLLTPQTRETFARYAKEFCKGRGAKFEQLSEDNWFFKLSAFQERLEQLFADRPDFVMPPRSANEAKAFIERGLHAWLLAELDQVARGREWQLEAPVVAALQRLARR